MLTKIGTMDWLPGNFFKKFLSLRKSILYFSRDFSGKSGKAAKFTEELKVWKFNWLSKSILKFILALPGPEI